MSSLLRVVFSIDATVPSQSGVIAAPRLTFCSIHPNRKGVGAGEIKMVTTLISFSTENTFLLYDHPLIFMPVDNMSLKASQTIEDSLGIA